MDTAVVSPAIVAGEVRQHRRNVTRGTSSTLLVRLRSSGEHRIMKQQVAMLLQQVMEVSDRLRQNEESSEHVRQLLEVHRTTGQMLEERMNGTEASVSDTSQAGNSGT